MIVEPRAAGLLRSDDARCATPAAPSVVGVDMGLQGSVAVVTGASTGIGLAITRGLVAEGARVVAGALHSSPELAALDGVTVVEVDLSAPDGPARLVAAAGNRVDVLVNNVGVAPPRLDGFLAVTDEMWWTTWTST